MAALGGGFLPRVINQDVAHQPRCERDEMRTLRHILPPGLHHPEHRIVDQVASGERRIALSAQPGGGDLGKFGMKPGDQPVARTAIAALPMSEQYGGVRNDKNCSPPMEDYAFSFTSTSPRDPPCF